MYLWSSYTQPRQHNSNTSKLHPCLQLIKKMDTAITNCTGTMLTLNCVSNSYKNTVRLAKGQLCQHVYSKASNHCQNKVHVQTRTCTFRPSTKHNLTRLHVSIFTLVVNRNPVSNAKQTQYNLTLLHVNHISHILKIPGNPNLVCKTYKNWLILLKTLLSLR